jgi:hypothetical protein
LTPKINIASLLLAIAIVCLLPLRKEIWYDETVSILCSKGISHDTPASFAGRATATSADLNALNTPANVFNATVLDNGNSYLYNIALHYVTAWSGNSVSAYMILSRLCAIATLLAFYALCGIFFKDSLLTSLALLFLVIDNNFIGMSHEIRAYAMGILFVTLSGLYFFRYLYVSPRVRYLSLTSLFAVCAVLSHFLTLYILLVLAAGLLVVRGASLFSFRNVVALVVPLLLLALFFYEAWQGLQIMSRQNHDIQTATATQSFSLAEVALRAARFTAIDFKLVAPSFSGRAWVTMGCLLLLLFLFAAAFKVADKRERQQLALLALLGCSSSVFLALLSIRAHHYTSLYNRYFSFCVPFCCLAVVYMLRLLSRYGRYKWLVCGLGGTILATSVMLFYLGNRPHNIDVRYNHPVVARMLTASQATRLDVPQWSDAMLVNSFLPADAKIDYLHKPGGDTFAIYTPHGVQYLKAISIDR